MNVAPSALCASHELEATEHPASGSQLHGMGVAPCSSLEGVAVILSTNDTAASSLFLSGKKSFIPAPSQVLKALNSCGIDAPHLRLQLIFFDIYFPPSSSSVDH